MTNEPALNSIALLNSNLKKQQLLSISLHINSQSTRIKNLSAVSSQTQHLQGKKHRKGNSGFLLSRGFGQKKDSSTGNSFAA